jgi:hypothetical protein
VRGNPDCEHEMEGIATLTTWGKTWAHHFEVTGCMKCGRISSGVIEMTNGAYHATAKEAEEHTKAEHRTVRAAINAWQVKRAEAGR